MGFELGRKCIPAYHKSSDQHSRRWHIFLLTPVRCLRTWEGGTISSDKEISTAKFTRIGLVERERCESKQANCSGYIPNIHEKLHNPTPPKEWQPPNEAKPAVEEERWKRGARINRIKRMGKNDELKWNCREGIHGCIFLPTSVYCIYKAHLDVVGRLAETSNKDILTNKSQWKASGKPWAMKYSSCGPGAACKDAGTIFSNTRHIG